MDAKLRRFSFPLSLAPLAPLAETCLAEAVHSGGESLPELPLEVVAPLDDCSWCQGDVSA